MAAVSEHYQVLFDVDLKTAKIQRKILTCRNYKNLDVSALARDLRTNVDTSSDSVDCKLCSFSHAVWDAFDVHVPLKERSVSLRCSEPWMGSAIFRARAAKRQAERTWRRSGLEVHRQIYSSKRKEVTRLIDTARTQHYSEFISNCDGDQRKLFGIVHGLLNPKAGKDRLPMHDAPTQLARRFSNFLTGKIRIINEKLLTSSIPSNGFRNFAAFGNRTKFDFFKLATEDEISKIIKDSASASCSLDPIPTKLLKNEEILSSLSPHIIDIINSSLESGVASCQMKHSIKPLLKKANLDAEELKNYRSISNLSFISKILERVVTARIREHLNVNNVCEPFQSAYKPSHSTEKYVNHSSQHISLVTAPKRHFCES